MPALDGEASSSGVTEGALLSSAKMQNGHSLTGGAFGIEASRFCFDNLE